MKPKASNNSTKETPGATPANAAGASPGRSEQSIKEVFWIDEKELLKRAHEVGLAGERYRKYVHALEIYRAKYDHYLAVCKNEIRKTLEGKVSEAELERHALASKFWQQKVLLGQEYLETASRAKIDFQVAMVKYESMRSALSNRKTEIKSFGG